MSLQTDYMESGLGAEEYIRTIWAETELTEDMLVDVDLGYFDARDIERTVNAAINDGPATQTRKDFYKMLVFDYVSQDSGSVIERYCLDFGNLDGDESSKREMLANMFTRVLRGELVATEQHRLPEEANTVLSQRGVNPWQARLDKLIALELGLRR